MTLLTDEHVSPAVANALGSEGIDAVTIYDTPVVGEADPDVLAFASENGYAVLTNDQDSSLATSWPPLIMGRFLLRGPTHITEGHCSIGS